MRRWISTFLSILMLTNVAVWPTAVIAEVLEHDRESIQLQDPGVPSESGSAHCKHGCAGHYGHHFQLQASSLSYQNAPAASATIITADPAVQLKHVPTLPFRPPLPA